MAHSISMSHKSDVMYWSTQLEEDCIKLATDAETEGDRILVAMVRISRLCHQATDVHRHLLDNDSPHATVHIGPLMTALDGIKNQLSLEQKEHGAPVYPGSMFPS
jgi:hypothetical protein